MLPRLAGLAMTGVVGVAAAMEPGATIPASVGTAMADQGIPGWASVRQGHACKKHSGMRQGMLPPD